MPIDPKININENQVIFKRTGGHVHDGLSSSLIDYTKYSIFDFVVHPVAPTGTSRRNFQETNVRNLQSFIVNTIEARYLNPAGIRIQANAITAREIVSGTITSDELAANIILVNNVIRSNNFNGTIDSNGGIVAYGNAGWAITHSGLATFNNVFIRGGIAANTGSIGGIIISGSSIYTSDYDGTNGFALYANGFADFNEVSVRGEIISSSGNIGNWTINPSGLQNSSGIRTVTLYPAAGAASDPVLDINYGGIRTAVSADGITCWDGEDIDLRLIKDSLFIRNGSIDVDSVSILAGDVQDLLDGKAGSTHTHAYAPTSHTHAYIPVGGISQDGDIVFENTNTGSNASGQNLQLRRRYTANGDNFIQFIRVASPGYTELAVTSIEFISTTRADFNHNSDLRLKDDIVEMSDSLDIISRMRPVNYRMKAGLAEEYEDGFIAQELNEVYPYSVSRGSDEVDENGNLVKPWGVYYGTFAPLLTSAIKELLAKVNSLEARIQTLEGV